MGCWLKRKADKEMSWDADNNLKSGMRGPFRVGDEPLRAVHIQ